MDEEVERFIKVRGLHKVIQSVRALSSGRLSVRKFLLSQKVSQSLSSTPSHLTEGVHVLLRVSLKDQLRYPRFTKLPPSPPSFQHQLW